MRTELLGSPRAALSGHSSECVFYTAEARETNKVNAKDWDMLDCPDGTGEPMRSIRSEIGISFR
jgi:hypothetical protein